MASADDLEVLPDEVQFGMVLEEGEFGEEYQPRQRNLGKVQHRKFTGYDQNLPMVIYGFREETVHGTSTAGQPQTLIIFRWGLQQRKRGRRFKSATLRAVFATTRIKDPSRGGGPDVYYDPHVAAVEPDGTYSLLSTPVTVGRSRNIEGGFEGGMDFAKGTAKVAHELSTSVTGADQIVINGTERNKYSSDALTDVGDPDRCNVAEWQLFENDATSSGLPTFFRTAVLLERRRRDLTRFTATFTIDAEVDIVTDTWTGIKRFIGLIPRDEPIIFDPTVDEAGRLATFKHNLDTIPLFDQCKYVMFKVDLDSQKKELEGRGEKGENED